MNQARKKILAAAERIYQRDGVAALSLRSVASDVGVTPMAIYRHYKDKDALVQALVDAGFARWEEYLAEAVRARSPLRVIERALLAYADFALAEPRAFELMFLTRRPDIPRAPGSLERSPSKSAEALIAAVGQAIESGLLVRDDPGEVLLLLWATVHGLVALHFTGRFGHDDAVFRQMHARATKRLLESLKP